MKIEIIDKIEAFKAIRKNWEDVYDADPQAQFFISWVWIFSAIKSCNQFKNPWSILAATNSDATDYVGFLPLIIEIDENELGFYNQLSIAGTTDAEHPGFLCLPEYEAEIVLAFAQYLQQQESWAVLEMQDINRENKRLNLFLSNFPPENFNIRVFDRESDRDPLDNVNNQVIPYVVLPDSWELYLSTISSNTRQKIRRFLKKIANSEYQITNVNAANLELHLEILTDFWRASWESRKGEERCNSLVQSMIGDLHHCFEHNCLSLPVLWQGERPLGAIANLIDRNKKTVLFMAGGRDETFKQLPPGFVLQAYAIRDAIENGFKIYDFLMGNEAYKYSFGARERYIQSVAVERRNWSKSNRKLDLRTLPVVFKIAKFVRRSSLCELIGMTIRF